MSRDNLIQFEAHRAMKLRGGKDHGPRARDPDALLQLLRSTKRLPKNDQRAIARNVGHLIERMDNRKRASLARTILRAEQWAKRKRYIHFSDDIIDEDARVAANGGTFAGIIDSLIKLRRSRGFDPVQARIATIHEILKGTSFRPTSHQTIGNNGEDAASFIHQMSVVLKQFARETQLADYFELISKYSVTPIDTWPRTELVEFEPANRPVNLFGWDDGADADELQFWTPWWAPKCVIGHLYIPFQTNRFSCTKERLAVVRTGDIGELNKANWTHDNWWDYIDELVTPELIRSAKTIYHRLPLWLVALPVENGLVWCLFPSIKYRDDFQVNVTLKDEVQYFAYDEMVTPAFVDHAAAQLSDDIVYFCEDSLDDQSHYVALVDDKIHVIGSALDGKVSNFQPEFWGPFLSEEELPHWLAYYPVQRLLKLTGTDVPAKTLLLKPREFTNFDNRYRTREYETLFRPAYLDPLEMPVPFATNTIAAYLMRNFTYVTEGGIFEALKKDALAKAAATKAAVNSKLSQFHGAFRDRFDE